MKQCEIVASGGAEGLGEVRCAACISISMYSNRRKVITRNRAQIESSSAELSLAIGTSERLLNVVLSAGELRSLRCRSFQGQSNGNKVS